MNIAKSLKKLASNQTFVVLAAIVAVAAVYYYSQGFNTSVSSMAGGNEAAQAVDQVRDPIILKVLLNDILYENISIKDNLDYKIDISKICKNNNLFKIDLIANNPKSLFDLKIGLNRKKRSIILNEIEIAK